MKYFIAAIMGLGLATTATVPVAAQDSLFTVGEKQNRTFADLGLGVITSPEYLGSEEDQVRVLPFVNAEYKGRLYLNPFLGAGVHVINNDTFRLSGGAFFAPNRDAEDTPFTNEAFDIDGGVSARISGRYRWKYAAFDVTGSMPVSGDMDGSEVEFRATTLLPVSDSVRIGPSLFANYQTSDWVNTLYGVSASQSAASGLAPLIYSDGFGSYGAAATAFIELPYELSMIGVLSYTTLDGDLKDSPLTPSNDGITGVIAISRTF